MRSSSYIMSCRLSPTGVDVKCLPKLTSVYTYAILTLRSELLRDDADLGHSLIVIDGRDYHAGPADTTPDSYGTRPLGRGNARRLRLAEIHVQPRLAVGDLAPGQAAVPHRREEPGRPRPPANAPRFAAQAPFARLAQPQSGYALLPIAPRRHLGRSTPGVT